METWSGEGTGPAPLTPAMGLQLASVPSLSRTGQQGLKPIWGSPGGWSSLLQNGVPGRPCSEGPVGK